MVMSPQTIRVARAGIAMDATLAWRRERGHWVVELVCAEFDTVDAQADDAFEALCLVRAQIEPLGWRVGVAGAKLGVWPSGMSRDQGGGLTVYQMTAEGAAGLVDTFEAVDPATVTTIVEQKAGIERLTGMTW